MRLIGLAVVPAIAFVLATLDALAQQTERVYRVWFLSLGTTPARHGMWHHLLEAMRTMNYVEGQNLVLKLG